MNKPLLRIVIADDEPITRMDLREMLTERGYEVAGEASDGFDAIELCRQTRPDVVLMDIKMPLLDGLSAARILFEEQRGPAVVILTAYSEKGFIDGAKEVGVSGYLVKPIDDRSLIPSIELAVARHKEMQKLQKDIARAEERLENRSVIEKAKGRVMERNGMNEQQAYDFIRRLSQTKNLSMRRVSEIILQAGG